MYHPDPHQLWNPLLHSCQNLSPPSSNVMDDLLDTKSNTCLQDDVAYGNECKIIASSFQHGFHYPMDLWLSISFVFKVSFLWLSSSNTSKQYGYSNIKGPCKFSPSKSYVNFTMFIIIKRNLIRGRFIPCTFTFVAFLKR